MAGLTALEQVKVRDFAQSEGNDQGKALLTDAANGDSLAREALGEGTGLSEDRVKIAAQQFLEGRLDQIFAAGSAAHRKVTGQGNANTVPQLATPGRDRAPAPPADGSREPT